MLEKHEKKGEKTNLEYSFNQNEFILDPWKFVIFIISFLAILGRGMV